MNRAGLSSCSTRRKKIEYVWDYYHWHFIIVLGLLFTAVFVVRDLNSRQTHDISIAFVSQYSYSESLCEQQAEQLSELAAGSSGLKTDVGLNLILLSDSESKTYVDAVLQTQLLIELTEGEGSLMLLDAHALDVIREYSEEYFSRVVAVPRGAVAEEIRQELYLAQKANRPDTEQLRKETEFFYALIGKFESLETD